MSNTTNETNVFDIFQDKEHDDILDLNDVGQGAPTEASSFEKATDLLVIGIILLAVVLVIDCSVRTYFLCRRRKRKRTIAPCPEGMLAAAIADGGTNDMDQQSTTRENIHRGEAAIDVEGADIDEEATVAR
ncbi:MAG: hypothetical protein SGARI_008217 [Bacillariaceae sp.]